MCGIIGILGADDVSDRLIEALRRLEYRGYDSAGIATVHEGLLERRRAEGKLNNLDAVLDASPLQGQTGIGHTRWATHGAPSVANAHPHRSSHVAVVHNGIIENFQELCIRLKAKGCAFESETDTEVIAHLLADFAKKGHDQRTCVALTLKELQGAFALAIIFDGNADVLYAARRGSPLVVGYGDGENYIGSDAIALANLTNKITYLEEGDWAEVTRDSVHIFDENDVEVKREVTTTEASGALIEKGNYQHFMLKEIYEQPAVVAQTLGSYMDPVAGNITLPNMPFDLTKVPKITIIACGTSYYAAMCAKYWFEQLARIPVEVDIASEFRYREPVLQKGGLAIFISQSGETADTLAALKLCKDQEQHIAVVVNVTSSSMAREADLVLPTNAGPEIGVASTKAFSCQLTVLAALAIATAVKNGKLSKSEEENLVQALVEVPSRMADVLNHDEAICAIAKTVSKCRDVIYLGRGLDYPIAMEGALKLKEISYIHAEGYAAGEMKHGPIALIDQDVPIIVIAPSGRLFEKTVSNMQEVMARKGQVILISDEAGVKAHGSGAIATITMPAVNEHVSPLLYAIPVQLLAYHAAVHKGTDVDQPRNLAKSVTVE